MNIEDRGYQFADGIYEVVHLLRRPASSTRTATSTGSTARLREIAPADADEPRRAAARAARGRARATACTEGLLYMQVTRGVARRDHAFPATPVPPALVVTIQRIPPYPTDVDALGRPAHHASRPALGARDIKSVGLLPNVLARQAAREQGAIEAILYDERPAWSPRAPRPASGSSTSTARCAPATSTTSSCPAAPAAR